MAAKPPKTKAREVAEEIDREDRSPYTTKAEKYIQNKPEDDFGTRARRTAFAAPMLLGGIGADIATTPFRKTRSNEDINELAREVAKGKGMKAGGKVSSASARADGKPGMRKALFNQIKGSATQGTAAGQWSARKAQLLAKKYKEKGGGYRG